MLAEVQHQTEGVEFLRHFVEGRLVSPLLLIGPSGVGKRLSVLKAIQETFCETRRIDCSCSSCHKIKKDIHPDVLTLTAVEKNIGIDDVRWMIGVVASHPSTSPIRCLIIDGADRFTMPAANAFLKTLEEPPFHTRFFLIAEDSKYVLPTIRSRCGQVRYLPLPEAFVLSIVQRYEKDSVKALVYTRMGEGSAGDAIRYWSAGRLTLRDQVLAILHLAFKKDLPLLFSSIDATDQDLPLALKFLEQIVHDIFMAGINPTKIVHADCLEDLKKLREKATPQVWVTFARKIKELQVKQRMTKLALAFHLKTIFVESL